jgi:protein phosphatase
MTTPGVESAGRRLGVPELSLVVLVGVSGSGKSTFARERFEPFEVVSSDFCRGVVSNDENDQGATRAAFEVLNFIVGKRLEAGLLTVVDATNVLPGARQPLVELARSHDVLPVAIVLDVPESVCRERNIARPDRAFGEHVVKRQASQLRRSLKRLGHEGFRKVHVLRDVAEVEAATIVRERLLTDRRDEHGPFDVIGDVHGCRTELEALLGRLGYQIVRDDEGRAVDAEPPHGRRAIFLGDLVDRGPDSPGVLRLVMGMVTNAHAIAVPGNHEAKLVRALRGRNVTTSHGLAETLEQMAAESADFRDAVEQFCDGLVSHLILDEGRLVVAHAGLKEAYHGRASGRVRSFALYGDTTGETDEFGLPVRYPWANEYRGRAMVLYGHTPTPTAEWINNTICLDTGCVFGGNLTALRYPEKEIVQVPAERVWYEPAKPLYPEPGGATTPSSREPDVLDVNDVMGKRTIDTRHHGRVTIDEENAAGALEVMSRFAIEPNRLLYLPPTMSPVATSARDDLLEHPDGAFDAYRQAGVDQVICEEKHMGSRAVALVCRDDDAATPFGGLGSVYTRTGRSFFDPPQTVQLLAEMRGAVADAGLWSELDADWLLLDGEVLPWSVKAEALIRDQYAATSTAAKAALGAAAALLDAAKARGLDVDDLRRRTERRGANAELLAAAYRRYVTPTDGLSGVAFAPFQVLAASGHTFEGRDHLWHLGLADRLVTADSRRFAATRRVTVDVADADSRAAAIEWWEGLTASGGEGMVVKPLANFVRIGDRLVQPGIKVRGREYLRLIYGPDYLEPANLIRLRDRNLGHKRSLAIREYALGLESLARAVASEPLWRVHEAVFAVLALESEPVDPRL